MPHTVTRLDRLRIERVVWSLDQRLYDLPSATRIARRREVRANLLAAAAEVGTTQALRRLGGSRALAQEYLEAELGAGPRHSWMAAALFLFTTPLVLNFFLDEAANAYQQAIAAAGPHSDGTFTWSGVTGLQSSVTVALHQGEATRTGGAWTPLAWVLLLAGGIACGRLWRALPRRRPQGARTTGEGLAD
ncbi:hypothetical protein ACFW1A_28450 [Kitasatospora sp. NPDC058965]|uniref:hypothetical protein n=1 Tax=Kitasatospora sp. NPDC058965 TaxID=3346682 RepID=UPI003680CD93